MSIEIGSECIAPAQHRDVPNILHLLGENVPNVAMETVWQLPWTWEHYWTAKNGGDGALVGVGALLPLGLRRAEIRGLAVAEQYRRQGVAGHIVECLLEHARILRLDAVCVTRRPDFFRHFGFEETIPAWLDLRQYQVRNARTWGGRRSTPTPRVAMTWRHGEAA